MKSLSYLFTVALLLSTSPLIAMDPPEGDNPIGSATKKRALNSSGVSETKTEIAPESMDLEFVSSAPPPNSEWADSETLTKRRKLNGPRNTIGSNEITEKDIDLLSNPGVTPPIFLLTNDLWSYFFSYLKNPGLRNIILGCRTLNECIKNLTSISCFTLNDNFLRPNASQLVKLTFLDFNNDSDPNNSITNEGISNLISLTFLNMGANQHITDPALRHLTKLRALKFDSNPHITDDGISYLPSLTSLDLTSNKTISGSSLRLRGQNLKF